MPRAEVAVAVLGDGIYVIGGLARHGLDAAAWKSRIYVISGGPKPGGSDSGANESFPPAKGSNP